jgi:hypothetical protein
MSKGTGTHLLTDTERYVLDAIQELRFGTVEVVVHDARIVQVEVSEKFRFDGARSDSGQPRHPRAADRATGG